MIVYAEPKTCVGKCGRTMPSECFPIARRSGEKVWRKRTCRQCANKRSYTPKTRRRQRARLRRLRGTEEGREQLRRQSREARRRRMERSIEARRKAQETSRRYYAARREDPEWMAARRVWHRGAAAKRRAQLRAEAGLTLPVAPLLAYLDVKLAELGAETLAEVVDLDSGLFRKWRRGDQETVKLDAADRILTRLGEPYLLDVLWPDVDQRLAGAVAA